MPKVVHLFCSDDMYVRFLFCPVPRDTMRLSLSFTSCLGALLVLDPASVPQKILDTVTNFCFFHSLTHRINR